MKRSTRWHQATTLAFGLAFLGAAKVYAENDPQPQTRGWIPYTHAGYVGLNLGTAQHQTPCKPGFECKNPRIAGKIYTGGMISQGIGLEAGYVNVGHGKRNGGETKAQGINVSLVGHLPLAPQFHALVKVGGTYGWTRTSVSPKLPGEPQGKARGAALTYGAALAFDLDRRNQLLAEWDRQQFKFASGRHRTDFYSLGWKYRF